MHLTTKKIDINNTGKHICTAGERLQPEKHGKTKSMFPFSVPLFLPAAIAVRSSSVKVVVVVVGVGEFFVPGHPNDLTMIS